MHVKLIVSPGSGRTGTTKAAFNALNADVGQLTAIGKGIGPEIIDAMAAMQELAMERDISSFKADEAMRSRTAWG